LIKVSINLYDLDQFLYFLAVNTPYLTQKKNKLKTVTQYSRNDVKCFNNLYLHKDIFCIHRYIFDFLNKFVFINNIVNIILHKRKNDGQTLVGFLEFYLVNFYFFEQSLYPSVMV